MDEEHKAEMRELWKREKMRSWLGFFFVLTVVFQIRWLILLACGLWIAYLVYCIRCSEERGTRIANAIVMLLPIGFLIANVVALIMG